MVGAFFVSFSACLLFITNVVMVAMVRHQCRGGRPNQLTEREKVRAVRHAQAATRLRYTASRTVPCCARLALS